MTPRKKPAPRWTLQTLFPRPAQKPPRGRGAKKYRLSPWEALLASLQALPAMVWGMVVALAHQVIDWLPELSRMGPYELVGTLAMAAWAIVFIHRIICYFFSNDED